MAKELSEIRVLVDTLTDERREYVDVPTDLTKQLSFLVGLQKRYSFPLLEEVKKSILLYPYESEDFVIICEKLVWIGDFFHELQFNDSLEGILRVREEISKREGLKKNLKKLEAGLLSYENLKAVLSGLVRVIVEFEHHDNYDGMRPVVTKILGILTRALESGLADSDLRLLRFIFIGGSGHE